MKKVIKLAAAVFTCVSVIFTMPVMGSASVPNSSNAGNKEDLPKGTPVDETRKNEIISEINRSMGEVKNFEYSGELFIESSQGVTKIISNGKADLGKEESEVVMNIMGRETKTYIKNGKNYIFDPNTNKFKYMNVGQDNKLKNSLIFKENASEYLTVEELQDGGFVIRNKSLIDLKDLSQVIGDQTEVPNSEEASKGAVAQIFYEISSDFRFKRVMVAVITPTPDGQVSNRTVNKINYSNYNEMKEIEFPDGLEDAELLEDQQNTSVPKQ